MMNKFKIGDFVKSKKTNTYLGVITANYHTSNSSFVTYLNGITFIEYHDDIDIFSLEDYPTYSIFTENKTKYKDFIYSGIELNSLSIEQSERFNKYKENYDYYLTDAFKCFVKKIKESRENKLEITNKHVENNKCSCDIQFIMAYGCKCGGV